MKKIYEDICESTMKEHIPRKSVSDADPPYNNKKVLRLKRKVRKYHNVQKHTHNYKEEMSNMLAEESRAKCRRYG